MKQVLLDMHNKNLYEMSSMSRIYSWIISKDVAGITANRITLKNVTDNTLLDIKIGEDYTQKQNRERNKELKSVLLKLGYGVTYVLGSYLEGGATKSIENSYIVVNLNDDPMFRENLFKLSEYYNQDSFLFKPKNDEFAYLIGTNKNDYPGYKQTKNIGIFHYGVNATYMSRIGTKGFAATHDLADKKKDDNPLSDHTPLTFTDRKKLRTIKEAFKCLEIETFDNLQINSKRLCDSSAMHVMESLLNSDNFNPQVDAYWISPAGDLIEVDDKHISTINKDPSVFGLTHEYIKNLYDKYDEKYNWEGNAREELITNLLKQGWIRIRNYSRLRMPYVSIQCKKLNNRMKDYLYDFADKVTSTDKKGNWASHKVVLSVFTKFSDDPTEENDGTQEITTMRGLGKLLLTENNKPTHYLKKLNLKK
jgi:hypothetical protein